MNSLINIPTKTTKNILKSFSKVLTHSCYNSLNSSINQISITKQYSLRGQHNYSSISNLYPHNLKTIQTQLKFYGTSSNQDSCNIQNACSSGIESNDDGSKSTESSKKFNNSETPFDIRHEGALTPMEKLLLNKLKENFEPTAIIKVKDISGK